MMTGLSCFKANDIRGKLGEALNTDIAYRIGRAMGIYLASSQANAETTQTVVVGGDIRLTSEALKVALTEGLLDAGLDVIDLGMTGTEEIYFATQYLAAAGGVEVTASHNPIDYNGMKLVREDAKPISCDTGLRDIQRLAETNNFPVVGVRGNLTRQSTLAAYVDHLLRYITPSHIKPMTLVVNAGNGAAGHVVDAIEHVFATLDIPVRFVKINHQADGTFPNGIPNPLLPERRADTRKAVLAHQADMGIAWDGDFDRCFLFDEQGQFVEGYYIVGLLAEALLQRDASASSRLVNNAKAKIIHDPRLTWNTVAIVNANDGIPVMSKTGHAFIKERMREEDAIYGGEMSAHHYFREFGYCDSGMIPWLLICELLSVKSMPLSAMLADRIAAYPASGEINLTLANPQASIDAVLSHYKSVAASINDTDIDGVDRIDSIDTTDGISLEFARWRFNLRASNTEPVVRLNVESRGDAELMQVKTQQLLALLSMASSL